MEETGEIQPANALGLERIRVEDFAPPPPAKDEEAPPPEFDKQFFLTVNLAGSKYLLAGREWDDLTQELSALSEEETLERRTVPERLFRILSELFHPLLQVENADVARKAVTFKLRAGGFVPEEVAQDPAAEHLRVQIRPGTILIAFFRYHNKDGTVREVQFLPWTYLVVDRITRGRVEASLVTGIRTPLGAKTSKRVHSLAVARRVRFPSTTLQLVLRKNPREKLAGHYITATAEKYPDKDKETKEKDKKSPELFKLMTDREGRLEIPVDPEHDILWLRVHSGNALLALVPFAPGLVPEIVLDLPDDSIRLAVEGDITQVKARLIDTVARRAALMIRARKYAEQKDWKKVDEEMQKLDELPSIGEFREQIAAIRVPALEAARQQKSLLTQRKVREICETATGLIEKYLSEERINMLKDDIRESRKRRRIKMKRTLTPNPKSETNPNVRNANVKKQGLCGDDMSFGVGVGRVPPIEPQVIFLEMKFRFGLMFIQLLRGFSANCRGGGHSLQSRPLARQKVLDIRSQSDTLDGANAVFHAAGMIRGKTSG